MRCVDCEFRNKCDDTQKVLTAFVKCYRREELLSKEKIVKCRSMEWISVKDRLPEDEKPVLAYYGFYHDDDSNEDLMEGISIKPFINDIRKILREYEVFP